MKETLPNYEEYASVSNLSTEKVAQIGKLAQEIVQQEALIRVTEQTLEEQEATLNRVQGQVLPELMATVGITDIKLQDGSELEVANLYAAHISEERRASAHAWLEEHGFGSLIKKEAIIALEKDKPERLELLVEWLHENKFEFAISEGVHFSTLQSFVKGQFESTEEDAIKPPLALFGVFVAKKAIIKNKNKKQAKRKYSKKK